MQEMLIKLLLANSVALACLIDKVTAVDIPTTRENLPTRSNQLHSPGIPLHDNINICREETDSYESLMEQATSPEEKSRGEKGGESTDHSYLDSCFDKLMVQAEAGYPEAQYAIGKCYLEGKRIEKNEILAFKWYMKAATQGLATAQFCVGWSFFQGKGVEKNEILAFEWSKKSAMQGHAKAQFHVGWSFCQGIGIEKNEILAFEWFMKAATQGDAEAQFCVGWSFFHGKGVEKNEPLAFEWFMRAAEQGHATAQNNVGYFYSKGIKVEKNEPLAFEWYMKAAKQGHATAQNNVAGLYAEGRGIKKNEILAFEWSMKAAKQGDAEAQCHVAWHFHHGKGTEKNEVLAFKWFREAAEKQNRFAQFHLGCLYAKGQGIKQDYGLAAEWYFRSAQQGHDQAKKELYNLLGKLGNSPSNPSKKLSELIEPVRDMIEIFIGENDLRSALNRPGWGQGRVDNPRLFNFYKILADFGTDIFNMLDAFYLPGFMVSFSHPAKIPDYKSVNASQILCKFESLKNLLCIGEKTPQVGMRLCQILGDDSQDNLLTFKHIISLLDGEIKLIMHNLDLLENERRIVAALNRSYSLLLASERSRQPYQEKGNELPDRSSVLDTEDKLLPVEYFRKGKLERAINDMISLEQTITAQRANLEFLQEQIAIVAYIKSGFLDVLYQGVSERNQLLKLIYPSLGE